MGGGGGGGWSNVDPDELARAVRDSENRSLTDAFEIQVNDYLGQQLAAYNDRDVDEVRKIVTQVVKDLGKEVQGSVDLLFGGSVAKHTYVDGLSDSDLLVLFDRTDFANAAPPQLRDLLADLMKERYGAANVTLGNLAVTTSIGGQSIQLLPAIRTPYGYKISSWDGNAWTPIHPETFTSALTSLNQDMGGKLVPTIKLAKAIISALPQKQQLSGYHIESLALLAFHNYDGPQTNKAMLRHFFEQMPDLARQPIPDQTGQSDYVDSYLGPAGSTTRRNTSLALARTSRRIENADGMRSLDQWKRLFNDE